MLSEVENRTPRSVRRLHGHRPLIPTVERRSGSGHLSPAQGVRPSGWRLVNRSTPWSAKALTREVRPDYPATVVCFLRVTDCRCACFNSVCFNSGMRGLAPSCVTTEGRHAMDPDSPGRSWPYSLLSHSVPAHARP